MTCAPRHEPHQVLVPSTPPYARYAVGFLGKGADLKRHPALQARELVTLRD